jgi:glyoxylase-like metal-dependent hydrolase (beta-lactamase superfamily II)
MLTREMLGGCLLLALTASGAVHRPAPAGAGLESYRRAREALDAAVRATGGEEALRAASTIRREMAGDWFGSGQSLRPYLPPAPTLTPPPTQQHARITEVIDYGAGRCLEEEMDSDDTGDFIIQVDSVTAESGFETLTYRREKPYYRKLGADDLSSFLARIARRHPEGLIRMALDRPETLEWVGDSSALGRRVQVVSIADPAGTRILLSFDAKTHLLSRSETLRSHPIAGDSSAEVLYEDYRTAGGLKLPFHVIDRVAGVPTQEMRVASLEPGAPFPEDRLHPPVEFVPMEADPPSQSVEKLADGLYLIRGPYNILFALFRDYVVVFEAPLNSRYSEAALRLVHAAAPDKPVRFVVASHFHYDHVGGLRPYAAEGVSIITTPDAREVIERVLSARHTLHPDVYSRAPKSPAIETVTGRRVIEDGTNRVELYDFGPNSHVAQLLAAYFPRQKLLFVADLWDVLSTDFAIGGADAAGMAARIRELGLDVERIIPVHGAPGTLRLLESAVAVREKYFPPKDAAGGEDRP